MTDLLLESEFTEAEALDAYSAIVTSVADRVVPSVAALRVGAGAAKEQAAASSGPPTATSSTSAHVVSGIEDGSAGFADGREFEFEVVGRDGCRISPSCASGGTALPQVQLGDADRLRVGAVGRR